MPESLISFQPVGKSFKSKNGLTLLEFANQVGIQIPSICNGERLCGKCAVRITAGIGEPEKIERKYFSDKELDDGYRLACKTIIKNDCTVWLLNEKEFETIRILTTGVEFPISIKNDFNILDCDLKKPSLENQLSDSECLLNGLKEKTRQPFKIDNIAFTVLKDLHSNLEKNDYKVSCAVSSNQVVGISKKGAFSGCFGIAVDLGTTTIVGLLIDLKNGKTIEVASRTNPQVGFGADVITRINYIINELNGLLKLNTIVVDSINEIILELCSKSGIQSDSIYQFSLAGNSVMNHIFSAVDPRRLAFSPYLPVYKETLVIPPKEIGLKINQLGKIFILPNISGYVGGDIVGLILSQNLLNPKRTILALDLGTNGEIVMGSGGKLLCCATAAGPAFEGGHISSGMRAASGAIDKVSIYNNKLHYHVINNVEPAGICGTGLIDLVSELLEYEVIDETGRILGKEDLSEKGKIFENHIRENGTNNDFIIAEKNGRVITLKQQDVRELQLAKGAVRAGIAILQDRLKISDNDIDEILIAGAFGSYISKESAMRIGLLPRIDIGKVKSIGNSASIGAKQFLLSLDKRAEAERIINETEYIELCTIGEFQNRFMEEMIF